MELSINTIEREAQHETKVSKVPFKLTGSN